MISGDIELNPGPVTKDNTLQLVFPIPWMILMQSRLAQLGLQSIDVGGGGDCFFRSVSHQLYGDCNYHMRIRTAGVQYMRDHPERFIESNTENSWLRYLYYMSLQGTWADALIIQAVAEALNVSIHITESNEGFAPLTVVAPIHRGNNTSTINIGHVDEFHFVSTTPLYSNRSCNSACSNIQNQINKQSIMPMYNVKGVQITNCDDWSSQDKPTTSSYVISHTSSDTTV